MKRLLLLAVIGFTLLGCNSKKGTFLKTITSQNSQENSVLKLQKLIKDEGLALFETIDHKANADSVKMNLKPEAELK